MRRVPVGIRLARVLGVAAVASSGALSLVSAWPHAPTFRGPARSFLAPLPVGASLEFAVRGAAGGTHQVTVFVGDRQTSFLHRGRRPVRYRLRDVGGHDASDPVVVRVEPAASVAFDPGSIGLRALEPPLEWRDAGPPMDLPPPVLAGNGRRAAEASIDETDTWGLRLLGVPVRSEPRIDSPAVARVSHGDRLLATCWTMGDRVGNDFRANRVAGYSAEVWYRLQEPEGFVPDVRFGRRAYTDRLGLPPCEGLSG